MEDITMKKTYIAPAFNEIVFKAPTLLAGSDPNVSIDKNNSVNAGKVESRGFDFWDDED